MVYKDECVYCFDTTESPKGVDVCLECHWGLSPARGFSALHTSLTGHDSFVNIRKTPLERRTKQLRLAIDAETDADLWETHTTVIPGRLGQAEAEIRAQKVLEADSYNHRQEVVAWELELQPCLHALELVQENALVELAASKCSQCDLDSNLWLCLSCGVLSCGRPQFGGGGGNGHALSHFQSSQHPVAIKLGSISDNKADAFCYACDEDVRDPAIAEHLATFGIDIATHKKTEKSMAELQLEQNAKFDFSMHDEHGRDLTPASGPGLTGMRNLGNTCYLNSVAQVLFALREFSEAFPANSPATVQSTVDPPNDLICQLSKLQDALNSGDYATPDPHDPAHQRGVAPAMLKHLVGLNHAEFATMRQQDAYEFFGWLMSRVSETATQKAVPDPASMFGYETNRRIECAECGATKYAAEPQESMSIQVPIERISAAEGGEDKGEDTPSATFKPVSFSELMAVETAPETVDLECSACHHKQVRTTQGFKSFPRAFVLNVRRFELVNWVPHKVDVPVTVPEEIDLKEYQVAPRDGEKPMPEQEFQPDREQLDQLTAMGFDHGKCVEALEATKNGGAEAAMNWLFLPESERPKPTSGSTSRTADPEQIATLTSMGFSAIQAEAALKVNGNVEAAIEWLFAGHAEDAAKYLEDTPISPKGDLEGSLYRLKGIVCHKGGSVHAGHYVAFVKRGAKWYLFNDEKVVEGADIEEMQKFAYLYFFERV